jgi:hypothetical protein
LVEDLRGKERDKQWGLKKLVRRVLPRLWTGAAPLTAAGEATDRGEEAGRPPPPVLCSGAAGGG